MPKTKVSYRLSLDSLTKIQKIKSDKNLPGDTEAVEHIIKNFDMNHKQKEPISQVRNIKVIM